MENILGQLHCRCRRSCRRALSTRRQCATQTVSCVLDNKDFLYLCVLWLTVNPKLMLLSFCSLLFVNVRLYVCVCVVLVCVWMFVSHCRDRMAAFGALSEAICVFILSMIHAPHMKMCNILTLTRAHKHTHTHASIQSHTHTRTQSGTCKTLTT